MNKEIKSIMDIPTEHLLEGGTPTCAGCGPEIGLKLALKALGEKTIVVNSSGCMSLLCNYPYTPLKVSWIHNAIENASATATGIVAALRARKRESLVMIYSGDGATYDIGFGSLSAMAARKDPVLYICYNNQTYGNTGNQWDSATPHLAATTTTPAGKKSEGNPWYDKPIVRIMADHGIYACTAAISQPLDYMMKLQKAKKIVENGSTAFIDLLGTCTTNWGFDPAKTVTVDKLAVETGFWPLYEINGHTNGSVVVNYKPPQLKPLKEFLQLQGRYKHLNNDQIDGLQRSVVKNWEKLLKEEARK